MKEVIFKIAQIVGMFFFGMIGNVLIGAFMGWFVGLFFGKSILAIFACLGVEGLSMWQIGAFLGFISSFFRKLVTFNGKK